MGLCVSVVTTLVQRLQEQQDSEVHLPGEPGYENRRRSLNLAVDPRPEVVVTPRRADQVPAIVRTAAEAGAPVAVQATGHGLATAYRDGVLLDVSKLSSVTVDPVRRTATVAGGTFWQPVVTAAAAHGLAPLSGTDPTVGVAGYTLGGGGGLLAGRYGLAADMIRRVELVTADGQARTVTAEREPDLFWALRGGGGGFGVVTELEFDLVPVTRVYGGVSFFDGQRAAAILTAYQDLATRNLDDLTVTVRLVRTPPLPVLPDPIRGRPVVGMWVCGLGDPARIQAELAPLLAAAGPPLLGGFTETDFTAVAAMLAEAGPPSRVPMMQQFLNLRRLSPATVDTLVGAIHAEDTNPVLMELRHWGGVLAQPSDLSTGPARHGLAPFALMTLIPMLDPATVLEDQQRLATLATRLAPDQGGYNLLNFRPDPADADQVFLPEVRRRLAEIKHRYDPQNLFRFTHRYPGAV